MERELVNMLPLWVFIALGVSSISIIISIIFVAIRKFFPRVVANDGGALLPTVIAVTSANYGFLLGFVVIVLWQGYSNAKLAISAEANALSLAAWDVQVLPEPVRGLIRKDISKYLHAVVDKEWPSMRIGEMEPKAQITLQKLIGTVQTYSPQTEAQKIFYTEIIRNLNVVLEKRHQRLQFVESILPDPLRFILVFGVLAIGFMLSLLQCSRQGVQLVAILMVCGIISFILSIAISLDYPFSGDLALSYDPFVEGILGQIW